MMRFAPSLTAPVTLSRLREALLAYVHARHRKERFAIRFEEADAASDAQKRQAEWLEVLELCGVCYDDAVDGRDSWRICHQMAVKLLQERRAFACFCATDEDDNGSLGCEGACATLPDAAVLDRPSPFSICIKMPSEALCFEDLRAGRHCADPDEIGNFAILDRQKRPTAEFGGAVADMLMDVSLVIRGVEHLDKTPRQLYVQKMLGYDQSPLYLHLPPLLENGKEVEVAALFKEGFVPEAILNALLLPRGADEFFELRDAIESPPDLKADWDSTLDRQRLKRLNREHLKRTDPLTLSRAFGFADRAIGEAAKCFLDEATTLEELRSKISAIFSAKPYDGPQGEAMERIRRVLSTMVSPPATYEALQERLTAATGLEGEALEGALRLVLIGRREGPHPKVLYPYLKSYLQEIVK